MAGAAQGGRLTGRARDAVFAPLESAGRAEVVARRLTDAIALGLLRDAEQLPSETDLAASFGVSPVTVREALVVLRHRGLVRTRRGRGGGSFVTAPPDPQAAGTARLRDTSLADLRDLCDHYVAVSATAARLAADRAGEEDVERLRTAAHAMTTATDAGACRRAEGAFHVEVAAASQSARLTREEIALQTEVGPLLWLPYDDRAARGHAVEQHDAILRAIAAGDEHAAYELTSRHVHEMLSRVGALYLDTVDGVETGGST